MIKPFSGNFQLTQTFGNKLIINGVDVYAQYGLLGHNGLDYGLPTNTQVIAPHNGKIIEATSDPTGYGNYIKIENDKEGSVLAHLATFQVKVGDTVSEGQPIALSDNTGNSTAAHLHWGYYLFPRNRQNGYAGFIDQLPLLGQPVPSGDTLDSLRKQRDDNWNLYQQTVTEIGVLKQQLADSEAETNNLQTKIDKAKALGKQIVDL